MANLFKIIGLMSGTSMDGIDVALLHTDGQNIIETGPCQIYDYPLSVSVEGLDIARHLAISRPISREDIERQYDDFSKIITKQHVEAVQAFLRTHSIIPQDIDYLVFHGQTVYHRPDIGLTVQLGDAYQLAKHTGIDVIYDLRHNDMLYAGQGAPLVPIFHYMIAKKHLQQRYDNGHIINIGGVSNMTSISSFVKDIHQCFFACDCGPGNAFIDDFVKKEFHCHYDKNGELAFKGQVHSHLIDVFLSHEYFSIPPPKSLDRYSFCMDSFYTLQPLDCVATLTALTADAIIQAIQYYDFSPQFIMICGGGRHNLFILERIQKAFPYVDFLEFEQIGFNNDTIEAQAFAYLGARHLTNQPLTFPSTTGVKIPVSGGKRTSLYKH